MGIIFIQGRSEASEVVGGCCVWGGGGGVGGFYIKLNFNVKNLPKL